MSKANDLAREAERIIGDVRADLGMIEDDLTTDQIIAVVQVHALRALTAAVLSIYWEMPDS